MNICECDVSIALQNISHALPPLQRNKSCEWCFKASECLTYHRSAEKGTEASSGVPDLFRHLTRGITDRHAAYFLHWDNLIDLEAQAESSLSRRLVVSDLQASASPLTKDGPSGVSGLSIKALDRLDSNALLPATGGGEKKGVAWTLTLSRSARTAPRDHGTMLTVGECVSVSVEYCTETHSCSDIEDTVLPESCETNISGIETSVVKGTIVSLSQESGEICLSLVDVSNRFRR